MTTIVYLDADDEITSAASRIREAADDRVGIVLPFGSRVATSRINFRLLAREAQANGRRIDIVAPDASARALAASAGLAVFASVGEYEAALDADEAAGGSAGDGTGTRGVPPAAAAGMGAAAAAGLASAAAGAAPGPGASGPAAGTTRPIDPSRDTVPAQWVRPAITEPASADHGAPGVGRLHPDDATGFAGGRDRGDRGGRGGGRLKGVFVLVVALALLGAGAAYAAVNVLPTAEITVTPRYEAVGPISFEVTADPDATAVDPAEGVIPATTVEIPVSASGEFEATGRKVVKEKARGGVRFSNCDPSAAYRIPAKTVVSTRGGTGFALDEEVFLPVAVISGTPPNISVKCTTSEVAVTATEAGTEGNVDEGAIRVVPARYNRSLVRVTNPRATSGGSEETFPRVKQEDVDAAIAQLKLETQSAFEETLDDPESIPDGMTAFPETAVMAALATDVDPETLVGQEVASFSMTMSGTGTVQAVDASPIEAIAADRLEAAVGPDHELVDGSIEVVVGEGSAVEGLISFPVRASAQRLRIVDPAALLAMVLGKPRADAEAALEPYGDVVIVLWPEFVTSVPSSAERVTLTLGDPVDPGPGSPAPAGTPTPTPTPATSDEAPTAGEDDGAAGAAASPSSGLFPLEEDPGDEDSSEPVPSG